MTENSPCKRCAYPAPCCDAYPSCNSPDAQPKRTVWHDAVRTAIADYMQSEGCSCCQDVDAHKEHEKKLAELLDVPMYQDGSGYNFPQFRSNTLPPKGAENESSI
jgi:hypothetical protein